MKSVTVILLVVTTACGTLFNDKTKTVMIQSQTPGHEIFVNGANSGVTPASVTISNNQPSKVVVKNSNGKSYICQFTPSVSISYVVLDILSGLVGIIIDAATGRWNSVEGTSCIAPF